MKGFGEAKWIRRGQECNGEATVFQKKFPVTGEGLTALLQVTSLGIYEVYVNGLRVGEDYFAPGWTSYAKRLQYQIYDVSDFLRAGENTLEIHVARGWCTKRFAMEHNNPPTTNPELLASLRISYGNGTKAEICTGSDWQAGEGPVRFAEIYDGETYDARVTPTNFAPAAVVERGFDNLIPQEGEPVRVTQELKPQKVFRTPAGDTVIDFGQNLTGFVSFTVDAHEGDFIEFSHAETMDKDGNFYTENYRSAKAKLCYTCKEGKQSYTPHFVFYGFRYIRADQWPGKLETLEDAAGIRALVVHSDMKRIGRFECSSPLLNRLYENIVWGQRGNFVDVPTDCPQRDERLGWTGDAEVFVRAASYNYDVDRFFRKWLGDMAADQTADGGIPHVVPDVLPWNNSSAAWGDAAVICPWQMYLSYGDLEILQKQFDSMRGWVEYIRAQGDDAFLWNTGEHFADWVGLDAEPGSYKGATDMYLIATAYYAYSTSLLIKAGKALGRDMGEYETLYAGIRAAFLREYWKDGKPVTDTQTAWVVGIYFDLLPDKKAAAAHLAKLVEQAGGALTTGFVGTPYLLHALSENGQEELAYSLLLREDYPSWLYSVKAGATTIWEHWDGIKPDGSMWSADMNSFNHYAYGAVADWMYGVMAGIRTDDCQPGFQRIIFQPRTDQRIGFVKASIESRHGLVASEWKRENGNIIYRFTVPVGCSACIRLGGDEWEAGSGVHTFIRQDA